MGYAAICDYNDNKSIDGSVGYTTYLNSGLCGTLVGGAVGIGIGKVLPALQAFSNTSFSIGGNISLGGAVSLTSGITFTGEQILNGICTITGTISLMLMSKKEKRMRSRSPVSWTNTNEGIEVMNKFNKDANRAADYIFEIHNKPIKYGAGTERNKIHKWLDRIIRKVMK